MRFSWPGVAMLTSAPFDDWWHNAYGLDVKIIPPPHLLLIFGFLSVQTGGLILALGAMNRASSEQRRRLAIRLPTSGSIRAWRHTLRW